MHRLIRAFLIVAMLACAPGAWAGVHVQGGVRLDTIVTADPDLFGEAMADEKWAPAVEGHPVGAGQSDPQYIGVNRPQFQLAPLLYQQVCWDFGFGIELAERFTHLILAPDRGLAIEFRRIAVPITITPFYRFALGDRGRFRPYVGAGIGAYYWYTKVSGSDLFNRRANPDYEPGGSGRRAIEFFEAGKSFDRNDWFLGFHGVCGLSWMATEHLAIDAGFRYEYVDAESIDLVLKETADGGLKWTEDEVSGDGGGYALQIGIGYEF